MSVRRIVVGLAAFTLCSLAMLALWMWHSEKPTASADYAQWAQTGATFVAITFSALVAISVPLFQQMLARRAHLEIAGKLCAQAMQTLDIRRAELQGGPSDLSKRRFFNPGSIGRAMERISVVELPVTMTTSFVGLTSFLQEAEKRFLEIEHIENWKPDPVPNARGLARYVMGPSKKPIIEELEKLYEAAETDFSCLADAFLKERIDIKAFREHGT